jgi:hypothetical protein
MPANKAMHPTVSGGTPLARVAPPHNAQNAARKGRATRPAGDGRRYMTSQEGERILGLTRSAGSACSGVAGISESLEGSGDGWASRFAAPWHEPRTQSLGAPPRAARSRPGALQPWLRRLPYPAADRTQLPVHGCAFGEHLVEQEAGKATGSRAAAQRRRGFVARVRAVQGLEAQGCSLARRGAASGGSYNYALNPTLGPVTALANGASAAPVPPAG